MQPYCHHCAKLVSINLSVLHPNKAASAGCHCLKTTISPPLSCLINNSDVQFRNFAINLLKYCWRMLIAMPVAIKAHLHNVCAKNNYELLITRRSPQKKLRATGLWGGGDNRGCVQMEGQHAGRRHWSEQWCVCTYQARHFHLKLFLFLCRFIFIHADGEIWDLWNDHHHLPSPIIEKGALLIFKRKQL